MKISGDLFRNLDGNIGRFFPESVYHPVINLLEYNDPEVKIEMKDKLGYPAIISKKIHNGLLVVSGLWMFSDDAALRKLMGIPLLGLNSFRIAHEKQLEQLLASIKNDYTFESFDRVILFSNSDSLYLPTVANTWVNQFFANWSGQRPVFHTINLLDGSFVTPPYISEAGIDYFGSGYLLKNISAATNGIHFETHIHDWNFIASILIPESLPPLEEINITANIDNGTGKIDDLFEINPIVNDYNKPLFFVGSAQGKSEVAFQISAKFAQSDQVYLENFTIPVWHDTSTKVNIISSILGHEKLVELFDKAAYDTASIVQLALKHNLLCDYTALIALEPNDSLYFMKNPFDESGLVLVEDFSDAQSDSMQLNIFPNPFNTRTIISIHIPELGRIELKIFNVKGQLVKALFESPQFIGSKTIIWNAENSDGFQVSSGIYFVQVVYERPGKAIVMKTGRMVLIR